MWQIDTPGYERGGAPGARGGLALALPGPDRRHHRITGKGRGSGRAHLDFVDTVTQEMDARIAFLWKLFAGHEIKVLPSGDRAVAERFLLATGRFHDVVTNEIE